MKEIDTNNWKSFQIKNIFTIKRPPERKQSLYEEGHIPFIASGCFNNGVQVYLEPKANELLDKGNCITISPVDGYAFYQKNDFLGRGGAGSSIILLYNENLNENNGRFVATVIRYVFSNWTYSNMGNKDIVKDEWIKLPVDANGTPDWQYMEDYMKGLEARAQKTLDCFVDCTSLQQ